MIYTYEVLQILERRSIERIQGDSKLSNIRNNTYFACAKLSLIGPHNVTMTTLRKRLLLPVDGQHIKKQNTELRVKFKTDNESINQ